MVFCLWQWLTVNTSCLSCPAAPNSSPSLAEAFPPAVAFSVSVPVSQTRFGIRVFHWTMRLSCSAPRKSSQLCFLTDEGILWQRRTYHSLASWLLKSFVLAFSILPSINLQSWVTWKSFLTQRRRGDEWALEQGTPLFYSQKAAEDVGLCSMLIWILALNVH